MGSVAFEAAREANDTVAAWTVHLHFPEFGDKEVQDFYWSTGDNIELEDGHTYEQKLREIPRGRHQKDRGNDYAEFSVANPGNALYQEFIEYEDIIEKGEVTIRECYEIEKHLWESEIRFEGYLKDFTNDNADLDIKFTAFSDTSRPNFLVGNRIITRERCGTGFNVNGVLPPDAPGVPCTWQTAQGGNPLFCSKFLKGIDGCEAHNNTHQFYAVEGFKAATITMLMTGSGDETGFPYQTGPCFTRRMFMVMNRDFRVMPMDEVQVGMTHLSFDIFDNDKLIESQIKWAGSHYTDHFWRANFDMAKIETAADHPFYIGNCSFVAVAHLGKKPAHGLSLDKKVRLSFLNTIERVSADDRFYEFHTSSGVYIVCDEKKRFFYFVHNMKPILPMN